MGDLIFVILNKCLINIKSGNERPINIGDFMPDYNLWYAFRFMSPGAIVILDRPYIEREYPSTAYIDAKIKFISKWLAQVSGVKKVTTSYSLDGSWRAYLFSESPDILQNSGIALSRYESKIFIDSNTRESENYIRENHPDISYMTCQEFIDKYNKNPRRYEKKPANIGNLGRE